MFVLFQQIMLVIVAISGFLAAVIALNSSDVRCQSAKFLLQNRIKKIEASGDQYGKNHNFTG